MDNYYTSPTLLSSQQQLRYVACDTVHVNRQGMPKASSEVQKSMLAVKWQDKWAVLMLSTILQTRTSSERIFGTGMPTIEQ